MISGTFVPYACYISGITNAVQAVVTFTAAHAFGIGGLISFRVSPPYGMTQINNISSRIISLTTDTVTVEVDSSNFSLFVYPPVGLVIYPAMAVPAGSGIVPNAFVAMTTLADAFDDLPPN